MSQTINLGSVTAYASAVEGGYTGTYADFCAATANVAEVGELQADTMPTASADRVGQVIQYTGATSNDYTHGYFYECVDNSGTYSWQNVSVQVDQAGHTIVDSTGTDMTQRNKLKFIGGAAVTDDSTNNQTIVDVSSKVDETNISLVQTTLTATKNYAVNDPFIYDGQLYKADSAISNGGTIIISGSGQNVSTTTVEELLSLKVTASGGESGNTVVTFTDASADAAITSGDTLKSIVAKVKYKLANLSGGHTILNSSGTAMNQRGKLQFANGSVTDNSANDKTIVDLVGTYSEGSQVVSTANQAFNVVISATGLSTSSKILSVCTSVKGLNYTDITLASGTCTIAFPGVSSAQTVTAGIVWR